MEPISAALILAGLAASSAAAVYTNKKNIEYAQEANDSSIALANTAHQREVRDLRAAGLNPILSASGSGSAVPQLKVPDLANPFANAETSAKSLAASLNGTVQAQRDLAQSEASTAKEVADLTRRENMFDQLTKERQALEDAAYISAMDDDNTVRVYGDKAINDSFHYGNPTWENLRDQYRREIEKGRYESQWVRSLLSDVLGNAQGAAETFGTSARGLKMFKGLKLFRR